MSQALSSHRPPLDLAADVELAQLAGAGQLAGPELGAAQLGAGELPTCEPSPAAKLASAALTTYCHTQHPDGPPRLAENAAVAALAAVGAGFLLVRLYRSMNGEPILETK